MQDSDRLSTGVIKLDHGEVKTKGFGTYIRNLGSLSIAVSAYGEKGVRKQMEDEHLLCPSICAIHPALPNDMDFGVYGIFDGHGGSQTALFVKDQLTHELANQLLSLDPGTSIEDDVVMRKVLGATFSKLDSRIATELPSCKDGCTAAVVLLRGNIVITASLGDSGAFLARQMDDKKLHAISLAETHKTWVIKEKERILKSGGTIENGRVNGSLEVTRSFGDISFKKFGVLCTPTLRKFSIEPAQDKFLIIGCDGFWNLWPAPEVVSHTEDIVLKEFRRLAVEDMPRTKIDVRSLCKNLVEYVIVDKKSQDNVSVLAIIFTQ